MYKVFINDKPIFLVESLKKRKLFETVEFKEFKLSKIIELLDNSSVNGVELLCQNLQNDWKQFKAEFSVRKAAGGKVFRGGDVLFIYRFDKWDLPKGHIEKGEKKKTAAIREVQEECGISDLEIVQKLETTYHAFFHKGKWCLKVTYWYLMKTDFQGELIPQVEEGITAVVFKDPLETQKALENTYSNIKLLF